MGETFEAFEPLLFDLREKSSKHYIIRLIIHISVSYYTRAKETRKKGSNDIVRKVLEIPLKAFKARSRNLPLLF